MRPDPSLERSDSSLGTSGAKALSSLPRPKLLAPAELER